MSLLLLFAGFVVALVLVAKAPRFTRTAPGELAGALLAFAVLGFAGWRMAFPSQEVDFDTWSHLVRWKFGRTEELYKMHRPIQYAIEHWLYGGAVAFGFGWPQCRVVTCLVSLAVSFCILLSGRRIFFSGGGVEGAMLWLFGFLLSAGGEFMVDSWNDHCVLIPFYLAGVAAMLRWRTNPKKYAVVVALLFLAESLCHSAEPWLWAAALPVVLLGRDSRKSRTAQSVMLVGLVMALFVLIGAAIVSSFPGGGTAGAKYIDSYRSHQWSLPHFREYAESFSRGGVGEIRARLLFPVLALVVLVLAPGAIRFRRPSSFIFCALFLISVAYPWLYETANPERYYTIAVLWPILGVRGIQRLKSLARLRRRNASRPVAHWSLKFGAVLLSALFVTGAFARMPVEWRARNAEQTYNEYGKRLGDELDPVGVLLVAPEGSFYLWMEYFFEGEVRRYKEGDNIAAILASYGNRPVYTNEGYARKMREVGIKPGKVIFERPGDPASVVYQLGDW
ncbi:MAG: hypothetical protein K1X53_14970 [Candidatus Sumerlaeaceae bacterium]|nr:hypothetical protein [Candidatus Sumerlaeaceae bacterium]